MKEKWGDGVDSSSEAIQLFTTKKEVTSLVSELTILKSVRM